MRIVKPDWLRHDADKKKPTAIFSVDFSPDGARLATGGMDNKVRLWSTAAAAGREEDGPRLLSTLSAHSGAVMCVRFSHGGRQLATGADDMAVLVWERDTADDGIGGGNIAGAGNVETWRPVRRLAGHESDVCDVAWAPRNRFLATCGFDNNVFVWDGRTFERVAKLTAHSQFVKGLTFDPAGKYLATQSDDKTLRVWRTSDWQVQATVDAPFQDNIFSTYFRRPSWSPDGDCIAAANAANGKVPVAAVVERGSWAADKSFVGHHAAIEAVRFCPRVFRPPPGATTAAAAATTADDVDAASICATAAQDRSVAVWLTSQPVPLVVAPNLFSANVLDLAWHVPEPAAPEDDDDDGAAAAVALLAACSHDGSVALVEFQRRELGAPVPIADQEAMLARHGWIRSAHRAAPGTLHGLDYLYESDGGGGGDDDGSHIGIGDGRPQPMAESVTQLRLEERGPGDAAALPEGPAPMEAGLKPPPAEPAPAAKEQPAPGLPREERIAQIMDSLAADHPEKAAEAPADPAEQPMPVPVRTENGRRRVAPLFVRPLGGGGGQAQKRKPADQAAGDQRRDQGARPAVAAARERVAVDVAEPIESRVLATRHMVGGGAADAAPAVAAELGPQTLVHAQSVAAARVHLSVPAVVGQLALGHGGFSLVAHNGRTARVACSRAGQALWAAELPRAVVVLAASELVTAAALRDGSLHWLATASGARLGPPIAGEALPAHVVCRGRLCLLLDCVGQLSVWDALAGAATVARVSIAPLLYSARLAAEPEPEPEPDLNPNPDPNPNPAAAGANGGGDDEGAARRAPGPQLRAVGLSSGGAPVVRLSDGRAFAYSARLGAWACIADAGAFHQSEFCVHAGARHDGALEQIQAACAESRAAARAKRARPAAAGAAGAAGGASARHAATLEHLEHQLWAAHALHDDGDVVRFADLLARHLARSADAARAAHWLHALLGPPLARGLAPDAGEWQPALGGVPKRRLLQRMLPALAANRHLQALVAEYQAAVDALLAPPPQ
ncbi:HIR complex subunit [Coemansia javaensis]|uniref:Protein HIR n=1 Tax=Coemansia javaensis TaxID=2761396 RepID=A0A9W8H4A0_9FUNG|nr:HIR complex subunit [Coemansia javaensis]